MSQQPVKPHARINITLDVETANGKEKKELPFKLLVMGRFSGESSKGKLAARECFLVNKSTLNQVLKSLAPTLQFRIENKINSSRKNIAVDLSFTHMNDFSPDAIIRQVPELCQCYLMRELLKDIKSHLLDNPMFAKELEKIMQSKESLQSLKSKLDELHPQ